jgi:AP-2 complex subunit sigma-1
MIRYLLLQNRAGKTRLAKYYIPLDDAQKHALEYEVHKLIANRDPKFTNFVEVSCCGGARCCESARLLARLR